jgi:hypothetical protein
MYPSTNGSEQGDDEARRLLHELANDLAAIQMRADILLAMGARSDPTSPLVHSDLIIIRSTAEHAITITDQFGVVVFGAERPVTGGSDV